MLIDVCSLSGKSSKDNEGDGKGMGEGGEKEGRLRCFII